MYHVSIYFDDKTRKKLEGYIKAVAQACGNSWLPDNNVLPHITVAAFNCYEEDYDEVVLALDKALAEQRAGKVHFVSLGEFIPGVIYAMPVLSRYLQELSEVVYETLRKVDGGRNVIDINKFYQPFNWLPHVTLGKMLSKEQMINAFVKMQDSFETFGGQVIKIGLAKTNPYKDINIWHLD